MLIMKSTVWSLLYLFICFSSVYGAYLNEVTWILLKGFVWHLRMSMVMVIPILLFIKKVTYGESPEHYKIGLSSYVFILPNKGLV